MRYALWVCFPLLFVFLACSPGKSFEDPRVEVEHVRITGIFQDAFDLEGTLRIVNPNEVQAKVTGYSYRLEVEGRRLVAGESDKGFPIAPRSAFRLTVPGTVYYQDLASAGKKAMAQDEIRYRFSGTLLIDTLIGKYPIPFDQEGRINLSEVLREKTRRFLEGL